MPAFVIIALGAAVAGFVQGLSGFAFSMVAMSFWAWVVEPKLAMAMAVLGGLAGQIIAAVSIRRGFDWKTLAPYLAGGLVGLPIGVALLPRLDPAAFKAVIGFVLLIWCPIMLFSKHLPSIEWGGRSADAAVGLAGGVLGGIGGFTGAIPSLWCTVRAMDRDAQRSVIQNFNLSMLAVTAAVHIATGTITRAMAAPVGIVLAAMVVPTMIGMRVYAGISDVAFRRVVLTCLTASGIALLASSLRGPA